MQHPARGRSAQADLGARYPTLFTDRKGHIPADGAATKKGIGGLGQARQHQT
jgi:hypothetical protein